MKKTITIIFAVISLYPYIANAKIPLLYENPRIGMELGHRTLKWEEGLGKDHFAESLPQLGVFVELPIFEQFNLKFGHEKTVKRNKLVSYAEYSFVLNNEIYDHTNYLTTTKLTSNYIDAIYNYTISKQKNCIINLIVFFGVSKGKLKLTQTEVSVGNVEVGFETQDLTTSRKANLRTGIGLQSLLTNGIIIKIGITHENTSKLKSIFTDNRTYTAKAKNSIIFNIGIAYQL